MGGMGMGFDQKQFEAVNLTFHFLPYSRPPGRGRVIVDRGDEEARR
jgi:hypothetical protein